MAGPAQPARPAPTNAPRPADGQARAAYRGREGEGMRGFLTALMILLLAGAVGFLLGFWLGS
jgi:hypothetical protein